MKSIQSKFICASSALVLSFAMLAGTAEAKKRIKHDWDVNPAAYAPDGLGDYGSETAKIAAKPARKTARKVAASRKVKTARKVRYDWLSNPEAYAPDGLSDYGTVAVQTVSESGPATVIFKAKTALKGQYDWHINPADYAPDGLGDYAEQLNTGKSGIGIVQADRDTAPSA